MWAGIPRRPAYSARPSHFMHTNGSFIGTRISEQWRFYPSQCFLNAASYRAFQRCHQTRQSFNFKGTVGTAIDCQKTCQLPRASPSRNVRLKWPVPRDGSTCLSPEHCGMLPHMAETWEWICANSLMAQCPSHSLASECWAPRKGKAALGGQLSNFKLVIWPAPGFVDTRLS
jgi:hypothetical protein